MSLSPEIIAKYSAIIDAILSTSDINTISAKQIRRGLQVAVDYDITPQKNAITELIMERFDKFEQKTTEKPTAPAERSITSAPNDTVATSNGLTLPSRGINGGHKARDESVTSSSFSPSKKRPSNEDDDDEDVKNEQDKETRGVSATAPATASDNAAPSPAKKPRKTTKSTEDDDAAFAARLQAQENSLARSTRGNGSTKRRNVVSKAASKKSKKTKSARKIKDEDDSDAETGSGAEKKEVKRTGGFHKPMNLSPALAMLLDEDCLSRPQTVKKVWDYIKANDLQDPNDKRQIRCDDAMRAVFKQERVHMFTMNKILGENLYPKDEE